MKDYIGIGLGKLAEFETKHYISMILIFLIITSISVVGLTKLQFQSDLSKNNPKDLDVVKLNDRINSKFSEKTSPIIILVEIDENAASKNPINDIRDPRVINFIKELKEDLLTESKVREVKAASDFFPYYVPDNLNDVKSYLDNIPGSESIFNEGFSLTPVFITTDLSGADETKVRALNKRISEIIDSTSRPGGIKLSITGEPPLAASIFRLLIDDALYTLIIATILIFILLLIIERSLSKSIAIMIPLLLGLIWTIGALGLLNIPISIGTVGLSAMLLGLGVEYSIFLFSRYDEERRKASVNNAIITALSTTGASTLSSGLTTVIGFAVLTLSIFPILADMGFSLALGISIILGAIFVTSPVVIIIEEKVSHSKITKKGSFIEKTFDRYGNIVSKRPYLFVSVFIAIALILFYGGQLIKSSDINFNNVLPSDMPELIAFNKINYEFTETNSINIYIELDPSLSNSDEPTDIRDPRIVNYVNLLSEKAKTLSYFENVNSVSLIEKKQNNGIIPSSLPLQKSLLENIDTTGIISDDYSATIVRITLNKDSSNHKDEVIKQIKELISETSKPAGIYVVPSGSIILEDEFNKILGPDSSKTAIYAFILIIVLLLIFTRSIKYTILPLLTVVFALIFTTGLMGYLGIAFNPITSSVLSMTIGVGINFGIQISMRYKYEREKFEKRKAMKETLKNTLYPLTITLIAALIGFRAMTLGKLKIMQDLGNVISIGVMSAMIVSITLVASLIIILDRKRDDGNYKKLKYPTKNTKKEVKRPLKKSS